MKKKRKGLSWPLKISILGGVLIVAQGVFLIFFTEKAAVDIRESIQKKAAEQKNIDPERRELLKVQLAITDYMVKNKGNPPKDLKALVPTYFDEIPVDPFSGDPYSYRVEGKRFFISSATVGGVVPAGVKSGAGISQSEQTALIAGLAGNPSEDEYVYDPTGKRDPFAPFDLGGRAADSSLSPLERYEIGQLKLTAVLGDTTATPKAIVENATGRGFTIEKGTKIGTHGGTVVEILKDRVLILEVMKDFTGEEKNRTVELRLRTKAEEEAFRTLNALQNSEGAE